MGDESETGRDRNRADNGAPPPGDTTETEREAETGDGEDPGDEYVCEACERSFDSERALRRHLHEVGLVD